MPNEIDLLVRIHPDCPNKEPICQPAKQGDVGYDLKCWLDEPLEIPNGEMANIRTGVFLKLPKDTWADIRPRSSTFAKRKLFVMGGTIDEGYTGEISIFIWNPSKTHHTVENGDRLAQLVICPRIIPRVNIIDKLPITQRGASGFGSTDE